LLLAAGGGVVDVGTDGVGSSSSSFTSVLVDDPSTASSALISL
jgi:hypothetical protein